MTLIIILACVFFAVFLMVILGEKFAKPMSDKQQKTYGKIIPILVFILLISAIIKAML
jgi:membrane protein insertase Oxa1/YidC/SpoIIIJ